MKVFIKTEGGRGIGYGHVMRCLSLAQAFREKGIEASMWVRGNPDLDGLTDGIPVTRDPLDSSSHFWSRSAGADVVIVDSYLDTADDYRRIAETAKLPVYLDDNRRLSYPRGMVLNGAVGVDAADYGRDDEDLIGSDYILLRRAFWDVAPAPVRPVIESVLLTFGAEDPRGLTIPILRMLVNDFPGLTKRVIVGAEFAHRRELEGLADSRTEFIFAPDAKGIVDAIRSSDVAVSAGGQTLNELARLGVPPVIVKAADNQTATIAGWQKAGFGFLAGEWDAPDLIASVRAALTSMAPEDVRRKHSVAGSGISDGQGPRRVVAVIERMM